jgi:hypothetical protein
MVEYSTLRDGVCVNLEFVLQSHDPSSFPTPPPVFDYATETALFDQIIGTYTWLAVAPTATATLASTPVNSPTPTFVSTPVATSTPVFTATAVESPTPTFTFTPVVSPTATPLPFGMLTGQVLADKPVTVSLYNPDNSLAASIPVNVDGTFSFTISPGTYSVVATASGFLSAQGSVTLTSGNTTTLPSVTLLAGDIDGNNVIDPLDALTIGMNYNGSTPSSADLNNDGVINVLDLELLANNYRVTGPVPWQ